MGSASDFTQKDHSFKAVYSLGVQTTYIWLVLTHLSGWWGLNRQTHPDC